MGTILVKCALNALIIELAINELFALDIIFIISNDSLSNLSNSINSLVRLESLIISS